MNSTGLVLPLDTSLTMDGPTMTSAYSTWQASSHDLMQTGILNTDFAALATPSSSGPTRPGPPATC